MKTVIKNTLGTPRLRGNIYCGPQCGAGCTKQQFDSAKAEAEETATLLGKDWTPVVCENMGWHAKVTLGTMRVDKCGVGKNVAYRFDTGTSPQFLGKGKTPQAAVKDGLSKMLKHARAVADDCQRLTDAAWPTIQAAARRGE